MGGNDDRQGALACCLETNARPPRKFGPFGAIKDDNGITDVLIRNFDLGTVVLDVFDNTLFDMVCFFLFVC